MEILFSRTTEEINNKTGGEHSPPFSQCSIREDNYCE